MTLFIEQLISGLTNGAIYAAMALALVMVYRGTGTINFAQGEMALFTTYLAWGLTNKNVPVVLALLISCVVGFTLGAVVERTLMRPIQRQNDLATLIVMLGLFTALNSLDGLIWGQSNHSLPSLFPNSLSSYISIGGARLYFANIGVWLFVAVVFGLLARLFNHTRLGLLMRATANNKESASLSGVKVGSVLMIGWGLAATIGAIAGVLITPINADSLGLGEMFPILIYASAAALFGGLDSPLGAVVAGLAIGLLEAFVSGYLGFIGGNMGATVAFAVIIIVLLFRPSGLFGSKEIDRV